MKPEQYNPKAREAFGKSLVDVGVGIIKGTILLFTVSPLALLLKGALDGTASKVRVWDVFALMTSVQFIAFLVLCSVAMMFGTLLRDLGLKHIHESGN